MRVVYVARGLSTGLYKIGITHYPPERVRSLAAWLQEPVEMLAGFPGEVPDERAAQRRFAQYLTAHPVTGRPTRELFADRDGLIAAWAATLPPEPAFCLPPRHRSRTYGARRRHASYLAWLASPAGIAEEARFAAELARIRERNERLSAELRTARAA